MDSENILNRIYKHINNKQIRDISRVKKVLNEFNNPEKDLKVIHVAGTNGKGSVCASLSSILTKASCKTGLFTSPHLVKINERIKINNIDINDEELEDLLNKVEDVSKKINIDLSFFEILTIISIIYFSNNNCDICIFEAGIGGEYDATNIFNDVEVSSITNIGFDHMEILGDTIEKITEAKAGIIKNNSNVVIYDYENEFIKNIIKEKAKLKNANIIETDFSKIIIKENNIFDYKEYKDINIKLIGIHQIYNACEVIEIIDVLKNKKYKITDDNIKHGFLDVNWSARYQVISEKPYIVLDGAHNELCIDAILPQIKEDIKNRGIKRIEFLVAFLKDKDVVNIIKKINTLSSNKYDFSYLITTIHNDRAYNIEELEGIIKEVNNDYKIVNDPYVYIKNEINNKNEDKMIIVTGSLYLMGEILKNIKGKNK